MILPYSAVLAEDQWLPRQAVYQERVRPFTEGFLRRRSAGQKHPVEDFLFTYYSLKPGQLMRWHPGAGVVLTGAAAAERADWKFYRPLAQEELAAAGLDPEIPAVTVDVAGFAAVRGTAAGFTRMLLSRTAARKPSLGCFGMHEWAMAYKSEVNGIRHEYLGLRLGAQGTNDLVEQSRIRCTHFDAFRNRRMYGCNTAHSRFYDEVPFHPEWLLAEFACMFHPELCTDSQDALRYYAPLELE